MSRTRTNNANGPGTLTETGGAATTDGSGPVAGAGAEARRSDPALAFDQANLTGAGPLGRFFLSEFDPLPFTQQLEDRAPDGTAMKKMLNSPFIANKAEAFVDEEPCNRARRHTRVLRDENP